MAWCPFARKRNIPPTSNDPRITPDTAVLHIAASNGDSLYDWFNGPSGGIESHFYVLKNGLIDQYRDTAYQADAQMARGKDAISIETEGLGAGEWTPQQIASIKRLLAWLHGEHPSIPLKPVTNPAGPGIGYHSQYKEWSGDGRTCPGPDRIKQYFNVLVPWMMGEAVMSSKEMRDAVRLGAWTDSYFTDSKGKRHVFGVVMKETWANAASAALDSRATLAIVKDLANKGTLTTEQISEAAERGYKEAAADIAAAISEATSA